MANKPLPGCFIIGRNLIFFHIFQNDLQNLFIFRYSQLTVDIWDDTMGAACIKTAHRLSFFVRSDRILRLVAIVKGLVHTHDGLHQMINRFFVKTADTHQIIADFAVLEAKLLLVG